jgi:hypothetical protein
MKNLFTFLFPNIEKLSQKDSPLSTKRYAHLRVINHFVWQSWASFIGLIYFKQWDLLFWHLVVIGAFAFLSGVLATKLISGINGRRSNNDDDKQ